MAFVHYTVKKIVHGLGAIKEAANEVKNLKGSKAFIVTDPGLAKIGVQKPLEEALTAGGIEWKLYAEAQLEPSMDSIQHCTDEAKAFGADVIIGFGGGSALDTTKAASVLLSNEGPIDKYFGINLVPNPSLPCILIPTTSGTGSEMTNISVLADTKNGGKKGVVSEYMYADTVILDAELTFGLPPRVTAMTGVDAFVHAMESFCGIAATPITDALNLQAMKLVGANIRQAYANGKNAAARDAMMYASALAGMGFGNTRREARQLVNHGHFTVNGKRVNIPSFQVKPGDVVAVCEKSRTTTKFKSLLEENGKKACPKWIEKANDSFEGKVVAMPARDDIDYEVAEHLIVELYSK